MSEVPVNSLELLTMSLGFSWRVVGGEFCCFGCFFSHCWNLRCILMGKAGCGIVFCPLMNQIKLHEVSALREEFL